MFIAAQPDSDEEDDPFAEEERWEPENWDDAGEMVRKRTAYERGYLLPDMCAWVAKSTAGPDGTGRYQGAGRAEHVQAI